MAKRISRHGAPPELEPTYPAGGTFIKPDLTVASLEGDLLVADVTVASDGHLQQAYNAKMLKYGTGQAAAALGRVAASRGLSFRPSNVLPLVWSQRGDIHPSSVGHLLRLGLTQLDLQHAALTAIRGSLRCHAAYHTSTFRT